MEEHNFGNGNFIFYFIILFCKKAVFCFYENLESDKAKYNFFQKIKYMVQQKKSLNGTLSYYLINYLFMIMIKNRSRKDYSKHDTILFP